MRFTPKRNGELVSSGNTLSQPSKHLDKDDVQKEHQITMLISITNQKPGLRSTGESVVQVPFWESSMLASGSSQFEADLLCFK